MRWREPTVIRARHRRIQCCIIASALLAGLITWLLSKRHAALHAATTGPHAASPELILIVLFGVLTALLTLVTFTVASIVAARRRARNTQLQAARRPAPGRRRYEQAGRR
jgi:hypothetical protein